MLRNKYVSLVLILLVACVLAYFVSTRWSSEKFQNANYLRTDEPSSNKQNLAQYPEENVQGYNPNNANSKQQLDAKSQVNLPSNTLPSDCYPRDQLRPSELLPADANSTWAQVVPQGQGSLQNKNFLNAGYHLGVNTVGQTLRNANRQLRSEPNNPQVKISPWNQTTIEPDTNRRPLEMGCTTETQGPYCVNYNA